MVLLATLPIRSSKSDFNLRVYHAGLPMLAGAGSGFGIEGLGEVEEGI